MLHGFDHILMTPSVRYITNFTYEYCLIVLQVVLAYQSYLIILKKNSNFFNSSIPDGLTFLVNKAYLGRNNLLKSLSFSQRQQ